MTGDVLAISQSSATRPRRSPRLSEQMGANVRLLGRRVALRRVLALLVGCVTAVLALLVGCITVVLAAPDVAAAYTLVPLTSTNVNCVHDVSDINSSGDIVGLADFSSLPFSPHPTAGDDGFFWHKGLFTPLNVEPGWGSDNLTGCSSGYTNANALNDSGLIVGVATDGASFRSRSWRRSGAARTVRLWCSGRCARHILSTGRRRRRTRSTPPATSQASQLPKPHAMAALAAGSLLPLRSCAGPEPTSSARSR